MTPWLRSLVFILVTDMDFCLDICHQTLHIAKKVQNYEKTWHEIDYRKVCLKTFFEPRSDKEEAEGYNIYNPHFTIAPETSASYALGEEMIYDYLKAVIKDDLDGVSEKDLSPGKFNFIINADGYLQSVEQNGSCGIKTLDEKLKKALSNLPGKWIPAKNAKGENVSQQLVLSYGLIGC